MPTGHGQLKMWFASMPGSTPNPQFTKRDQNTHLSLNDANSLKLRLKPTLGRGTICNHLPSSGLLVLWCFSGGAGAPDWCFQTCAANAGWRLNRGKSDADAETRGYLVLLSDASNVYTVGEPGSFFYDSVYKKLESAPLRAMERERVPIFTRTLFQGAQDGLPAVVALSVA
jgi:hypothetical protein